MKKSWIRYCVRLRAKGWAPLVGHTLSLNAKKQHKVFETISVEEYCVIWWQAVSSNIRGRWKATGKIFCNFNQIFRYTCRIMPKRVKSSKGPSSRQCAGATQILSKKMLLRWRAVGNTASDLTGPRFEPQTSRFQDERVTAGSSDCFRKLVKNFLLLEIMFTHKYA